MGKKIAIIFFSLVFVGTSSYFIYNLFFSMKAKKELREINIIKNVPTPTPTPTTTSTTTTPTNTSTTDTTPVATPTSTSIPLSNLAKLLNNAAAQMLAAQNK